MDKVINSIKKISLGYPDIHKVILFGSRARGDNTAKSDYDVAFFAPAIHSQVKNQLLDKIENIDTLYKIDIVFITENTNQLLKENIKRDGTVIMDKFQIKLDNYSRALSRLCETIEEFKHNDSLSIRDGAIQRFEFTTELAWKTIREYLLTLEITGINNPKAVLAEAFKNDIIEDEDCWIQILHDRNSTSHIYDEHEATEIYQRISTTHVKAFKDLLQKLLALK